MFPIFKELVLPEERNLLIDWLTSEDWPFHVYLRPSAALVSARIEEGYYTGTDHQTFWIIIGSHQRAGLLRLFDLNGVLEHGGPDFDLRIRSAYRGRGIGRSAVQWLTRKLFEDWPALRKISSTTRDDNHAMRKVFRNCGYAKEAHFRKDWPGANGEWHDNLNYAILREDWISNTVTPVNWNDEVG